jgi:hypothetical protein
MLGSQSTAAHGTLRHTQRKYTKEAESVCRGYLKEHLLCQVQHRQGVVLQQHAADRPEDILGVTGGLVELLRALLSRHIYSSSSDDS